MFDNAVGAAAAHHGAPRLPFATTDTWQWIRDATLKLAQGQRHAEQLRRFSRLPFGVTGSSAALNTTIHCSTTSSSAWSSPSTTFTCQSTPPPTLLTSTVQLLLHDRVQYVNEHMYKRLRPQQTELQQRQSPLTSIALA
ncbi:unnamed protein product, partial [Mesorhabditis spiculigera]